MGKSETAVMRNKLVEDGLDSYLDALTAVREFQKAIIERSRRALEGKLDGLSKAMGVSIDRKDIKGYLNPDGLDSEELGDWGWVGIEFKKEPMHCYFGLYFKRQDSKCVMEVSASMYTNSTASQRDFLLEHCKKVSKNFTKDNWEICLDMPISKEERNNFEAKLHELIDKWIEVWKEVGGIKNLPKK